MATIMPVHKLNLSTLESEDLRLFSIEVPFLIYIYIEKEKKSAFKSQNPEPLATRKEGLRGGRKVEAIQEIKETGKKSFCSFAIYFEKLNDHLPWHGVCNSAMAGKGTNYLVHAIFPAQKT